MKVDTVEILLPRLIIIRITIIYAIYAIYVVSAAVILFLVFVVDAAAVLDYSVLGLGQVVIRVIFSDARKRYAGLIIVRI